MSPRVLVVWVASALLACGTTTPQRVPLPENCGNKTDDDGDGKVDCLDPDCFADPACTPVFERCDNGVDDTGDGLVDCADPSCEGHSCGASCLCVAGRPVVGATGGGAATGGGGVATGGGTGAGGGTATGGGAGGKLETLCHDGLDNDGDGLTDCADPDCVGAGVEICDDGIDNTCDRAIDCGDPRCSGSAQCANLRDGSPCLLDGQCAGNTCLAEATSGAPNGSCSNAVSCDLAGAGCNGGHCLTTSDPGFNRCFAPCTGSGLGSSGRCRAGYACLDPDSDLSNDNNGCVVSCTTDSECAGQGTGYGCNAWSKTCTNKDHGLGRYGAACTTASQCETNRCLTGANWPGGYCAGRCRGDLKDCAAGGWCGFDPKYGDNVSVCFQQCAGTQTSTCRDQDNYSCLPVSQGSTTKVCVCLVSTSICLNNADCCSNSCTFYTCD
jgi:hypothetical protein